MNENPYATPRAEIVETSVGEEPKSKLRRAFWIILCVAVFVGILVLLAGPSFEDYAPRARVSEGILAVAALKQEINERLQSGTPPQSVGAGLVVPRGNIVKGGTVAENGSIYVVVEEPPAVVTMTIANFNSATKQATWRCVGWPAKVMPASCREAT